MTSNEFREAWKQVKALWPGWAKSIEGAHEPFNVNATYKMFHNISATAMTEAVDQHFAEKGTKRADAFGPLFPRIMELAKESQWRSQQADPLREIFQTWVSMLPRVMRMEREVEYFRRMSEDRQNSKAERDRYAALVVLGNKQLEKWQGPLTELEVSQLNRANEWRRRAEAELRGDESDAGVRDYVRSMPAAVQEFKLREVPNA